MPILRHDPRKQNWLVIIKRIEAPKSMDDGGQTRAVLVQKVWSKAFLRRPKLKRNRNPIVSTPLTPRLSGGS